MNDSRSVAAEEICQQLASRLRAERLERGLQQAELALLAGVSRGTVITMERSGQCTFESLVRIALALGLAEQLSRLFQPEVGSTVSEESRDASTRKRVRRSGLSQVR